jgi:hypothetical protein
VAHKLATKINQLAKTGFGNRLGAKKRLLKAKKSKQRQMNYCENECTPQGTRIQCMEVTSRYKKYRKPIPVVLRGISDELVTSLQSSI